MKYLKTIRKHVKEISNTLILIEDAEETCAPKDYICERYDLLLRQTEALTCVRGIHCLLIFTSNKQENTSLQKAVLNWQRMNIQIL